MASRARALLRKWFGRGQYPTSEQFSDVFDSFFHKSEDRIPVGNVEGLPEALNSKYGAADGRELEKRVDQVADNLTKHEAAAAQEFSNIQDDLERLDSRIGTEETRSTAEDQRLDKAVKNEAARAANEEESIRKACAASNAFIVESFENKVDKVAGKGLSTEDFTTKEKAKLALLDENAQLPDTLPATIIVQDTTHRFVTDSEKTTWNNKAAKTTATTSAAGLMSSADKQKLNGIDPGKLGVAYSDAYNLGGDQADITTAQFIEMLAELGALSRPYWMVRGNWSFYENRTIADTGIGRISLTGAVVEVMGKRGHYTIRITTARMNVDNGVDNTVFLYINDGSANNPGWFKLANGDLSNVELYKNLSNNGFYKAPDGLLIQWGTAASPASGPATVYYPISFDNSTAIKVLVSPNGGDLSDVAYAPRVLLHTSNYFTMRMYGIKSSGIYTTNIDFDWLAIGRWK